MDAVFVPLLDFDVHCDTVLALVVGTRRRGHAIQSLPDCREAALIFDILRNGVVGKWSKGVLE
jgi:hypothetical protein